MKLSQLSSREKYALAAGIIFIIIYISVEFIVSPYLEKQKQVKQRLKSKAETLVQMRRLKSEFHLLKDQSRQAEKYFTTRPKDFTLFSFLDNLASKAGIKDNIDYMKPSKSKPKDSPYNVSLVELKLQGINLKQLTPYLHMVETSKNMIFIRRISITKTGKKGLINAILQVETFES